MSQPPVARPTESDEGMEHVADRGGNAKSVAGDAIHASEADVDDHGGHGGAGVGGGGDDHDEDGSAVGADGPEDVLGVFGRYLTLWVSECTSPHSLNFPRCACSTNTSPHRPTHAVHVCSG